MKAEKAADHGFSALRNALAARRKVYGTTIRDLHAVFDAIDKDGSGALDHDEFGQAMHRMGLGLSKAQVASIIQRIDSDGNGEIDYEEFAAELAKPVEENAEEKKLRGALLPASTLAKFQWSEDETVLNEHSWTLLVRESQGRSIEDYISHVEFRLPEDSGFDESVVCCYEPPYEISRVGHSRLKVLITIHLKSGGGYCVEHELSFKPGGRLAGGGHGEGGRLRKLFFRPVEAKTQVSEDQARKEAEAAEWWAKLEAERERHSAHPRFPGDSESWTAGMRDADSALRDRAAALRAEHHKALQELQELQEQVSQAGVEESVELDASARSLRQEEAARIREDMAAQKAERAAREERRAEEALEQQALRILRNSRSPGGGAIRRRHNALHQMSLSRLRVAEGWEEKENSTPAKQKHRPLSPNEQAEIVATPLAALLATEVTTPRLVTDNPLDAQNGVVTPTTESLSADVPRVVDSNPFLPAQDDSFVSPGSPRPEEHASTPTRGELEDKLKVMAELASELEQELA